MSTTTPNVVGIGARMHTSEEALEIIDAFLSEPYSNEPRHQRRIDLTGRVRAFRARLIAWRQ